MGLDALLENQLGHWPKFQKLHIYSLSTSGSVEIELVFILCAAAYKIRADFQNCHIWAWNLAIGPKFQKLHIYSLSTPGGWNWAHFCSTGSGFGDMRQFLKLPLAKVPKVAHIPFFYPWGSNLSCSKWRQNDLECYKTKCIPCMLNYCPWVPNFNPFRSMIARFPHDWGFWFLYRLQWWIWNF